MRHTKIICTIGPASDKKTNLKTLMRAGMDIARLNFSHNVHAYHGRVIKNLRALEKSLNQPLSIIQDLQGPRLRLGDLGSKKRLVKKEQIIVLNTSKSVSKEEIPIDFPKLHLFLEPGQRILIDDGLIQLRVKQISGPRIRCQVVAGGALSSHKGINLPDSRIKTPAMSEKDKSDLEFGLKQGVDFVALSFVGSAKEIQQWRNFMKRKQKSLRLKSKVLPGIIAKIERKEALENLSEIIQASDAILIARGDLGLELPAEDVPLLQKMITDRCLRQAKPVIVATQMLNSMIEQIQPTRAEVSDVANAVIDHADALMLSGETASGQYPLAAVNMMHKVISNTERSVYDDLLWQEKDRPRTRSSFSESLGRGARALVDQGKVKLILAVDCSGETVHLISRYRPEVPIYVACPNATTARSLNLIWGVMPLILAGRHSADKLVQQSKAFLKKVGVIKKGDQIIIVAGHGADKKAARNLMEVQVID